MPTYVYKFEDGSTVEVEQSIHEEALVTIGNKPVKRVYSSPGVVLKGKGFYRNGG